MNHRTLVKVLISLVTSATAATVIAHADVQIAPFQPNTLLTAGALNAALQALKDNANHPVITRGGAAYSTAATTCGGLTPRSPNLGGWKSSKTLCESACASPSAHVCTEEDVLRSLALSTSLPFSTGGENRFRFAAGSAQYNSAINCVGWTTNAGSGYTPTLVATADGLKHGDFLGCNEEVGIACCD